jgi:hypothetical protein
LDQEDLQAALSLVEEILPLLVPGPLAGPVQSTQVYETCIRVLRACNDARGDQLLASAYQLLQGQADTIPDQAARRTYLQEVKANQEIMRMYAALKSP